MSLSEVIPVHEVSSKDGSNIDDLVDSIGGVIARSSVSRGSMSLVRDTAAVTAAPSMIRQQVQPPPSISAPVPVSSTPPQPRGERLAAESTSGNVLRLERQQDELHMAIAEQQDVVAHAKAAAVEVAGRVGELESAFGSLQQNFEGVLQKIMAQQTENAQAVAALQQSATAHEQRAADEASTREKLSEESQARGQRNERALSSLRTELEDLNVVLSRVREDVKCATENNRQSEGRLKAVEEVVTAQEQGSGNRADTPPPVGGGDGITDSAAIIAEVEKYVDTRIADSNHQQTAVLQRMEGRLKDELAELLQEGLSGCESRLGAVEEELAECHLESASHVQEARNAAKSCATEGVAKAVEQAAQLLNEEVRRLEAEWEARMADLATDFETAAMLGGSSSQSEAETEERVSQLTKELSAAKASLAVNKTELELQQGEIAVLTNRADNAEEENAELRARMDKLQSMLLAMGDSPFASPVTTQAGGISSTHGKRLEAGAAHSTSSLSGENLGRGLGAADVSLRFDPSAMNRTTTDEIEADLMGTVNFNASYGDMSPMASPLVGADLNSSEFMLDSATSMPEFAPQVAQQQQQHQQRQRRMEERPWPSQRRASQDLGQSTSAAAGGSEMAGDAAGSSPPRRPRTAPPGWHDELERMLEEEKNESTAAMDAFAQNSQRRLSFRSSKRRQITPSDGTLRGYIRHCYDGCDDEPVRAHLLSRRD